MCVARVLEHPTGEIDRPADLGDVPGAPGAPVHVRFEEAEEPEGKTLADLPAGSPNDAS